MTTQLLGHYDADGNWIPGSDTFVGFGQYGYESTATDSNGNVLQQHFGEVITSTATDIWGDTYNDVMIAGGDKLQTKGAVSGDYTVSVDATAHDFDFAFNETANKDAYFLTDTNSDDRPVGQFGVDPDGDHYTINNTTYTAQYASNTDVHSWDSNYTEWLADHSAAQGWTLDTSSLTTVETDAGNVGGVLDTTAGKNGTDDDPSTDFWQGYVHATQAGSFDGAVNHTNNLVLDFAVGVDKLGLLDSVTHNVIDQTTFENNFHIASVNESGNWAGLVNSSYADPSTLTTPSTMIYTENSSGTINWSVTLLGVHLADLAGVDATAGDSAPNKDAVWTDLVGHV